MLLLSSLGLALLCFQSSNTQLEELRILSGSELEVKGKGEDKPAFFSCTVNSAQLAFIRSLSAIHKSACSCGGSVSHLFSIFASVGFEIACACLFWVERLDRTIMLLGARRICRRNILELWSGVWRGE
jgi:hypothetical protein